MQALVHDYIIGYIDPFLLLHIMEGEIHMHFPNEYSHQRIFAMQVGIKQLYANPIVFNRIR